MAAEYQTYKLGDWSLQNGQTIKNAHIAYKTFGDAGSPTIIYPTWYSGSKPNTNILLKPMSRTRWIN